MSSLIWISFLVFVAAMVMLDLGVFHRKAHAIRMKEALAWTAVWIAMAMVFNVLVYYLYENHVGGLGLSRSGQLSGADAATQFFTGYVLEKSLSVDNLFVIAMIFSYFSIPPVHQHRLLFWGILGAVVLRGIMIALGAALIERFEWLVYIFGVLLLISAVKMMTTEHDKIDVENNFFVRLVRRFLPVTPMTADGRMLSTYQGRLAVTPMFLALVLVETSDVMFAVDSIPAVFAVTRDPFLVFTSNIFAILGLRSMYFVLAGFLNKFRYLQMSLVFVLAYVGVKMLLSHHYKIPNLISLAIIGGILLVGVLASVIAMRRESTHGDPLPEQAPPTPEQSAHRR